MPILAAARSRIARRRRANATDRTRQLLLAAADRDAAERKMPYEWLGEMRDEGLALAVPDAEWPRAGSTKRDFSDR